MGQGTDLVVRLTTRLTLLTLLTHARRQRD